MRRLMWLVSISMVVIIALVACAGETVVTKEVIKEVPVEVEKEVIKEVPIEVEKVVEKEVVSNHRNSTEEDTERGQDETIDVVGIDLDGCDYCVSRVCRRDGCH